jgi:hypothetical protein
MKAVLQPGLKQSNWRLRSAKNSRVGINMVSRFSWPWERGALIENITFSNLSMDTILALQALQGAETQPGRGFRHIRFNNVRARVTAGAYVGGNADNYVEDIGFLDWDLHVHDETVAPDFVDRVRFPDPIEGCGGEDGKRALPAALYARHVDGLQARNVRVHWDRPLQRTWRNALWFEDCLHVEGPNNVAR